MIRSKTTAINRPGGSRKDYPLPANRASDDRQKPRFFPENSGIIAFVTVLSLGYAVVRYCIFKDVSWHQLPLFIMNKAVSLSSVVLLAIFYTTRWRHQLSFRRFTVSPKVTKNCRSTGYLYLLIHVMISTLLLKPAYYPQLYDQGKFNFSGELMLLFGIISILVFAALKANRISPNKAGNSLPGRVQYFFLGNTALLLISGHLFLLGLNNWLTPAEWPGYLPPITLLAFFGITVLQGMGVIYFFAKINPEIRKRRHCGSQIFPHSGNL